MANIDISMPVEHLDELLGALPGALPPIGQRPQVKGPSTDEAAPVAQKMGAEQGALPPIMQTAQPRVLGPTSPESQIEDVLGSIHQTMKPRTTWSDLSGGQKVGRVFSDIGQAVGTEFAPRLTAAIPGTELYKQRQLGREFGELKGLQEQLTGQAQQKEIETRVPLQQAQAAYYGAEIPEITARGELAGAQADMYKQALKSMQDPKVTQAFSTLSDPNAPIDQRRSAMATIAQSPIGMLPSMRGEMTGATSLYREGEIGSRMAGKNIVPDASSPTGYSTTMYDHYGNPIGTMPIEPSATGQLLLGPQGGQLMGMESELAGRRAAATQAQGLIPIISPETNEVIGYAPKGSVAGATGAGPTGMATAMAGGLTPAPAGLIISQAQAGASLNNMIQDNILPNIDAASKAGEMGPAAGRIQDFLLKRVGDPDSPAAKLQATLDAVPMMLGRMYGYRSAEYAEHMDQFMNTRMTPDALKAYLSGVSAHARTIMSQGGMTPQATMRRVPRSGGAQQPQRPANVPEGYVFKADGPKGRGWYKP